MKKFLRVLVWILPVAANAFEPQHVSLSRSWTIHAPDLKWPRFDPSGLWKIKDKFLVISDRAEYPDIYELIPTSKDQFQAKTFLKVKWPKKIGRLDLEGLTFCGDRFYVIDEKTSTVFEIDFQGNASAHTLDLADIHKKIKMNPAQGTDNGGLEGIACNAGSETLYLANERMYRMIYSLNRISWNIENFFDVPAGWNLPRRENQQYIFPDYSDLYFSAGFLYALQRNDHTLLKIDPVAQKLISALILDFDEKKFYQTVEPYGLAEGLFLDDRKIYVLLDNNGVALKSDSSLHSTLLEFARPKRF